MSFNCGIANPDFSMVSAGPAAFAALSPGKSGRSVRRKGTLDRDPLLTFTGESVKLFREALKFHGGALNIRLKDVA